MSKYFFIFEEKYLYELDDSFQRFIYRQFNRLSIS